MSTANAKTGCWTSSWYLYRVIANTKGNRDLTLSSAFWYQVLCKHYLLTYSMEQSPS